MITNELIAMLITILISNLLNINLKGFYLNVEIIKKTFRITLNIDLWGGGKRHL
jgi:hypothetical protein